jgi:hypothetical protein
VVFLPNCTCLIGVSFDTRGLTLHNVPDRPIQFYRADHCGMASISFKSIYLAAKHRTALGNRFPRLERREAPESVKDKARRLRASAAGGVAAPNPCQVPLEKEAAYDWSAPAP